MPTREYVVSVREVHVQDVKVKARNEEHAKARVADGQGEYLDGLEYSHSLEPETWSVRRASPSSWPSAD